MINSFLRSRQTYSLSIQIVWCLSVDELFSLKFLTQNVSIMNKLAKPKNASSTIFIYVGYNFCMSQKNKQFNGITKLRFRI